MQLIRLNNNYYIWWGLSNGATDQYPRLTLYEYDSATPIQTIDFTHLIQGGYISDDPINYSGADKDVFGVGIVYSDSGHSTENTSYERNYPTFHIDDSSTPAQVNEQADLAISDAGLASNSDMQLALCLMQRRYAIDNPTFDANNNLTSCRIRLYSDKASVGTDNNVLETLNMVATFAGAGKVTTYKVADE